MKTSIIYAAVFGLLAQAAFAMPSEAPATDAMLEERGPPCEGPKDGRKYGNRHMQCEAQCFGNLPSGPKCKGKCKFEHNAWTCEL